MSYRPWVRFMGNVFVSTAEIDDEQQTIDLVQRMMNVAPSSFVAGYEEIQNVSECGGRATLTGGADR